MKKNTNRVAIDGPRKEMGQGESGTMRGASMPDTIRGDYAWPPENLPGFSAVPATSGSATRRNPRDSLLYGLSYAIKPVPRKGGGVQDGFYALRIEAWTYGVQNESMSVPVMDFTFSPACEKGAVASVGELKILARAVEDDGFSGARAMSVALFFINQINAGQVPDYERILKLHALYPQKGGLLGADGSSGAPHDESYKGGAGL